jgi:hypothetical protein
LVEVQFNLCFVFGMHKFLAAVLQRDWEP